MFIFFTDTNQNEKTASIDDYTSSFLPLCFASWLCSQSRWCSWWKATDFFSPKRKTSFFSCCSRLRLAPFLSEMLFVLHGFNIHLIIQMYLSHCLCHYDGELHQTEYKLLILKVVISSRCKDFCRFLRNQWKYLQ